MGCYFEHEYGIGINLADVDNDKYRDFLLGHKESLLRSPAARPYAEGLIDYLKKNECTGDLDFVESVRDLTCEGTIAEPIAEILTEETGISFIAPGWLDDTRDCVLLYPGYPWELSDQEKALTLPDNAVAVLKPYADEFGLPVDADIHSGDTVRL